MQLGQAFCTGNDQGAYGHKLTITPSDIILPACHFQLSEWEMTKIPKRAKVIGGISKRGASRHSNRLGPDDANMVWEFDTAFPEDRKNLACHPLDRNRC